MNRCRKRSASARAATIERRRVRRAKYELITSPRFAGAAIDRKGGRS
jgi:hypothetical protein